MPSAARAWHTTMSACLQHEGCETVGFEKSMRKVTIDGHLILLGAHIDDSDIACVNRPVLDAFRKRLLEAFDETYESPLEHYLECEIARDLVAGTTYLSQMHCAVPQKFCVHLGSGTLLHVSTYGTKYLIVKG